MTNKVIFLGVIAAICIVPLLAGQKAALNKSAVEQGDRPLALKKTPLEVRVRQLERKVKQLDKEFRLLLRDNRQHIANMKALNRKIKRLKNKGATTGSGPAYQPYRSYREPKKRSSTTITSADEDSPNSQTQVKIRRKKDGGMSRKSRTTITPKN